MAHDLAGTAGHVTFGFGYNPAGQIVTNTRSNDAYSFLAANESTSSTVNGLNQLVTHGGAAISHDTKGNLISDGATTFTYDSENKLVFAATSPTATLTYDPLGRLWEYASGTGATRFVYDGLNALAQYDPSGTLWRRYVHGPGVDEPLVQYEGMGATTRRFLHADERGSIVAMSDDAGNVVSINRYDEYGRPASGNQGAFQYTGQMWFGQLGLYYYKARMLDPETGRFMQPDPLGYWDSLNPYPYVLADPVNFIDPLGLMVICSDGTEAANADGCAGHGGVANDIVVVGQLPRPECSSGADCYSPGDGAFDHGFGMDFDGRTEGPFETPAKLVGALVDGIKQKANEAKDYVKKCWAGRSSINSSQIGRGASRGAIEGAGTGALRGAMMGNMFGPAGTGWGTTGGAVLGTVGGGIKGAFDSAVSQACAAGNSK